MALFSIGAFFALLLLHPSFAFVNEDNDLQTYIIHVDLPDGKVFPNSEDLESWYHSFLSKSLAGIDTKPRMVHTYKNVIKGFAARLTPHEFLAIQEYEECMHARPQKALSLHTTHSPTFLGLHQDFGFWKDSSFGQGVIIGVVDTGIFYDHPSFSDEGMPPPPPRWKGKCEFNSTVCNNKLIGVRYFTDDETPLDKAGHGTHTASTAAGNFVPAANVFGQANGTAAGMAPRAHLAIYKVCVSGKGDCFETGVLAAIDVAIEDGVDILSISIGFSPEQPFSFNSIALGAYTAMQNGIFVSCSAGNQGPFLESLSNEAPWLLTVGASTMDRKLKATVVLGNKVDIEGESIVQPKGFSRSRLSVVHPGDSCSSRSLIKANVTGKIVVCEIGVADILTTIRDVRASRAAAMILIHAKVTGVTKALIHVPAVPTIQISYVDGLKIISYINSTSKPEAALFFQGTVIGDNHAPIVASFSSRGPSVQTPGILKPDIIGPGLNVLAAWPFSLGSDKTTQLKFVIGSGTSMSCPHLSGVAALLRSTHPDWSPAAIKSAIMTSADIMNLAGNPIEDQTLTPADVFATGGGHVNPSRANNPGLIYDIEPQDYIPYLCGLQYTNREVAIITQQKVNCSEIPNIVDSQLNYPSFSIIFGPESQTYTRTVTNVGEATSTYDVKIIPPPGFDVNVRPQKLEFSEMQQKLTYEVTFKKHASANISDCSQGSLVWSSGKFVVRSPIVAIISD